MQTVNIKGKEYVPVNERIKHFRTKYPGWSITTSIVNIHQGAVIFKASIIDEKGVERSVGHAMESADSSFINKTSHIENCETSAIGRALGLLGVGIDASFASADEVANAMKNQGVNNAIRQ
jgi:hypothetical protein